jgi:hypothetical protein
LEGTWSPGINTQVQLKNDWLEKYSINLNENALRDEVEEDWFFWRPIVNRVLSYTEANQLDKTGNLHELMLINAALDKRIKDEKTPRK